MDKWFQINISEENKEIENVENKDNIKNDEDDQDFLKKRSYKRPYKNISEDKSSNKKAKKIKNEDFQIFEMTY